MTAQHTEEPWWVAGDTIANAKGYTIARVVDRGEETAGNAQLMAAAPDLLAAARWSVNGLDHHSACSLAGSVTGTTCTCARAALTDAIAKAEGRQP